MLQIILVMNILVSFGVHVHTISVGIISRNGNIGFLDVLVLNLLDTMKRKFQSFIFPSAGLRILVVSLFFSVFKIFVLVILVSG